MVSGYIMHYAADVCEHALIFYLRKCED